MRLRSIFPTGVCDWLKYTLADLVVLSDDPLRVSDDQLRKISSVSFTEQLADLANAIRQITERKS